MRKECRAGGGVLWLTRALFVVMAVSTVFLAGWWFSAGAGPPYQANGVKIGEVTHNSAIIWTRLTRKPEMRLDGVPFEELSWGESEKGDYSYKAPQMPEGRGVDDMQHSVPGMAGQVAIEYWVDDAPGDIGETGWQSVEAGDDFTYQFKLTDLRPNVRYQFVARCRISADGSEGQVVEGSFKTAPKADDPTKVSFTVVTGQGFWRRDDEQKGHTIYKSMLALKPDFFAHTGDIVYYDKRRPVAHSVAMARLKWNRIYALPYQRDFHNHVSSYFIKDDHDTWQNDCWPTMDNSRMGDFTFVQGQKIFLEQVPMGENTYRTVRWGKLLQIWMVEGRDFRSANTMPDGPDKTIWGDEQKAWFKRTVKASDATFRVLISPTPIVGPDRESKNDNHANEGFTYEGRELRRFIADQKNMIVICGDRHWQYVTADPETGLGEYSTGPTSNVHAGGFRMSNREPMHRYLNITGGFLSAEVRQEGARPVMTLRHHGIDGKVLNEDRLTAYKNRDGSTTITAGAKVVSDDSPVIGGEPWALHIIDGSSKGADGVKLADANKDGLLDIATGWEQGEMTRVYLNPGYKKADRPWPAVTAGLSPSAEDAVFVDLDDDGALDVVSSCEGGTQKLYVHWAPIKPRDYLNAESWRTEVIPSSDKLMKWMFAAPMDVNSDSRVDIVAGGKNSGAKIGWFETPRNRRSLSDYKWHPISDVGWVMSICLKDMDGDGDIDIAISDRHDPLEGCRWLENPRAGAGLYQPWKNHFIGGRGREVMFMKLADLDDDGLEDVVTAIAGKHILFIRRLDDTGTAWREYEIALPLTGARGKAVAVGDIDNDGAKDIAYTCEHAENESGVGWISLANGPASGNWKYHDISGGELGMKFDRIELLDLDGDGDLDLLTCEEKQDGNGLGVIWYENPLT